MNREAPENGRLIVRRGLKWVREAGREPILENSFKNSKANDGYKEQPLFRESFEALLKFGWQKSGPIFQVESRFLRYREIQAVYDGAFRDAGVEVRGTHIMRHAGCRMVYNENKGDLALVQQLLGNTSLQSTLVYAVRNTDALNDEALRRWRSQTGLLKERETL